MKFLASLVASASFLTLSVCAQAPLHFKGGDGPGEGKHIVLIAGDEEYRSEEALPQLAKILSEHHGFETSVLFSLNEKGEIAPDANEHISSPETIDDADLLILGLRFRQYSDEDMQHFQNAMDRAVPLIGLRTTTHAFKYDEDSKSPFKQYSFDSKEWEGGFGRQVMGETWVSHHGKHNIEGTRTVNVQSQSSNPLLKGVGEIFGKTDVYGANPPEDSLILIDGAVTESINEDSKIKDGPENDPMQPIAWTRELPTDSGKVQRVFTTTMGSSQDLLDEDLRRLLVNAVYWGLKMEDKIPDKANVEIVGNYEPTHFGFGTFKTGVKPSDLK